MWSWLYISHNSAAGAVKELIKSKSENDIVFTRCVSAFFLAREFDGFHSISLLFALLFLYCMVLVSEVRNP